MSNSAVQTQAGHGPLGGQRLALFDLDHTLLSGDSDVLWCDFLIAQGLLDPAEFGAKNADMEARYKTGTVGLDEFANFYVGTLVQHSVQDWQARRQTFLQDWIQPRIGQDAIDLVKRHQSEGDLVVMTTATNRFITELTAQFLNIDHLIATEPEVVQGHFTGRCVGVLNMRQGKVTRLQAWLQQRSQREQQGQPGQNLANFVSTAYSDSINDLPLLEAVNHPVAVNPDARLAGIAKERGWRVLNLRR